MEGPTIKILPKIVKGLGITLTTALGVGGAIAYYNYKTQKDAYDEVNTEFIKILMEINEAVGTNCKISKEICLKLQDAMLIKLKEPYLILT
jgi:hypothetical protein